MNTYRVVRLLTNRLYPSYQLYAQMDYGKTTPRDGLRLGALIVMDWLRQRLGERTPPELMEIPGPEVWRRTGEECLISLHMHAGFVIDIVSLPEQGIWSLQITEPDLGSNPGDPSQVRAPVPGRVIETNVGFHIRGTELECGFQTMISDPEGTPRPAEVYRLSPVRRLIEHPEFGLRQITPLTKKVVPIQSAEQLKALLKLWRQKENQLPCVIFSQVRPPEETAPPIQFDAARITPRFPIVPLPIPEKSTPQDPPYDMAAFAARGAGFCRTYLLADSLWEKFAAQIPVPMAPGDTLVLEPSAFGGQVQNFVFKANRTRQEEAMAALWDLIGSYPREKYVSFGGIVFLSAAREELLRSTEQALRHSGEISDHWAERLEQLKTRWRVEMAEKDEAFRSLTEQLARQRQYCSRLEKEKAELRQAVKEAQESCQLRLAEQAEELAYLRRKLSQPTRHEDIPAWAELHFQEKLLLHPKAVSMLEKKDARGVDVGLICDALDFLATDYWDQRYRRISIEEMYTRCSVKYGRPFEIKPTGNATVEFTPSQYKIKYFSGARGKPVESPLDYHLRVGNDPEDLLRIYFLHDDKKQLIVVGSLPRHLKTITIS